MRLVSDIQIQILSSTLLRNHSPTAWRFRAVTTPPSKQTNSSWENICPFPPLSRSSPSLRVQRCSAVNIILRWLWRQAVTAVLQCTWYNPLNLVMSRRKIGKIWTVRSTQRKQICRIQWFRWLLNSARIRSANICLLWTAMSFCQYQSRKAYCLAFVDGFGFQTVVTQCATAIVECSDLWDTYCTNERFYS